MPSARAIRAFVEHPTTQLILALILCGSGIAEIAHGLADEIEPTRVGVHHGVIVYGFAKAIEAIPHLMEGIGSGARYLAGSTDRERKDDSSNGL